MLTLVSSFEGVTVLGFLACEGAAPSSHGYEVQPNVFTTTHPRIRQEARQTDSSLWIRGTAFGDAACAG